LSPSSTGFPPAKRSCERFFQKLREDAPAWLKETWAASKRRGTDKLTMREINAEIAAVRRSRETFSREKQGSGPLRFSARRW
jgi:hypothetical protein